MSYSMGPFVSPSRHHDRGINAVGNTIAWERLAGKTSTQHGPTKAVKDGRREWLICE